MYPTLVILGACGGARQVYCLVLDNFPETKVVFVDDKSDITEIRMGNAVIPVIKDWDFSRVRGNDPDSYKYFVCGMGSPPVKKLMVKKALAAGLTPAPTLCDRRATLHMESLGVGGIIMMNCIVSPQVHIGNFVHLDGAIIVGHDSVLEDYVTCAPGVVIPGNVHLGEGTFLGVGAVVREGITIAPNTVAGAQSCIVKNITEPGAIVAGVPARPVTRQ